ncbi:MAG: hypothetical protein DMG81_00670 [Acidobacteria bacterium]|nr:MAG: hypothetical protein DMG81_00670 [Acidobacteriota bacterium]
MSASSSTAKRPGITLFATPKKFEGHIGVIQRNAIQSWTLMTPTPEIILFGDEPGTSEIAAEFGLRHVPRVKCNRWGTPLISDLFEQAEKLGRGTIVSYVNSDIILFDDFAQALVRVSAWSDHFLMVGRRTDLDIKQALDFRNDWAAQLRGGALREGNLQIARSIDYFAFSRGLYASIPALAIGRFWWDNWLLWKARSLGASVVDATGAVLVVHQNHDYSHTTYGPSKEEMMASEECILNARLTCEQNPADYDEGFFWRYAYTIDDATHRLTANGIQPSPRRLWKQFKRYSSRPLGMAKLVKRSLGRRPAPAKPKKAIVENQPWR